MVLRRYAGTLPNQHQYRRFLHSCFVRGPAWPCAQNRPQLTPLLTPEFCTMLMQLESAARRFLALRGGIALPTWRKSLPGATARAAGQSTGPLPQF